MNIGGGVKRVVLRDSPRFCRLIYSDGQGATLLKSHKHGLQGKPDFIFQSRFGRRLIPMELKSGKTPTDGPFFGDLMQLAAYFLIIEESHGKRPKRGLLRYKDGMYVVKNTARRRRELRKIAADMRAMLETGQGMANPSFVQCRYCVARDTVCEFTS